MDDRDALRDAAVLDRFVEESPARMRRLADFIVRPDTPESTTPRRRTSPEDALADSYDQHPSEAGHIDVASIRIGLADGRIYVKRVLDYDSYATPAYWTKTAMSILKSKLTPQQFQDAMLGESFEPTLLIFAEGLAPNEGAQGTRWAARKNRLHVARLVVMDGRLPFMLVDLYSRSATEPAEVGRPYHATFACTHSALSMRGEHDKVIDALVVCLDELATLIDYAVVNPRDRYHEGYGGQGYIDAVFAATSDRAGRAARLINCMTISFHRAFYDAENQLTTANHNTVDAMWNGMPDDVLETPPLLNPRLKTLSSVSNFESALLAMGFVRRSTVPDATIFVRTWFNERAQSATDMLEANEKPETEGGHVAMDVVNGIMPLMLLYRLIASSRGLFAMTDEMRALSAVEALRRTVGAMDARTIEWSAPTALVPEQARTFVSSIWLTPARALAQSTTIALPPWCVRFFETYSKARKINPDPFARHRKTLALLDATMKRMRSIANDSDEDRFVGTAGEPATKVEIVLPVGDNEHTIGLLSATMLSDSPKITDPTRLASTIGNASDRFKAVATNSLRAARWIAGDLPRKKNERLRRIGTKPIKDICKFLIETAIPEDVDLHSAEADEKATKYLTDWILFYQTFYTHLMASSKDPPPFEKGAVILSKYNTIRTADRAFSMTRRPMEAIGDIAELMTTIYEKEHRLLKPGSGDFFEVPCFCADWPNNPHNAAPYPSAKSRANKLRAIKYENDTKKNLMRAAREFR